MLAAAFSSETTLSTTLARIARRSRGRLPPLRIIYATRREEPGPWRMTWWQRDVDIHDILKDLDRADLHASADIVTTLEELSDHLLTASVDIVIADCGFSGASARDVMGVCRRDAAEVPLIFLISPSHEREAIECVRQGAVDYVLKTNLDRLPLAVWKAHKDAVHRRAQFEPIERAHHESEARFRLLFAKNPMPLFLYDLEKGSSEKIVGRVRLRQLAK